MANQESRLAIVIDTAKAEQNAKRLREVLKGISLDGSRTGAALGDLGGQSVAASSKVNKLNASTKELSSTLGKLKGIVAGAFAGIGIRSLLSTADTMQSLDSQVRLVTDSVAQFNAVQERLGKIANNQYADIEALTTLYTRSQRALSQLGKSQNEVLRFTENVSMAMRVGGASAQEQAAALLQLSQALGSGVLQGDEFRSIAEQTPILLSLVSQELGVTQGELKKLASEGKVTSEVIFKALSGATEELTEKAAQMPITVNQALTVLNNKYKRFVGNFINDTTGLSSAIAGAIGVIAQNFDALSTILLAGAAVWGYYALASSSFVVSTIPALVLGIQTSIMGFLSQTAAIQAAITAQGAAIASTFSLASMQGYLTATTYTLQQARITAIITLANYKLALYEAVVATQAKIASTAGAIAVQAQYAYSVATSGNLLAIFSLAVKGAAASLVAKVSATAAAARANAIYAASMVAIHNPIGATVLGIRALTGAVIAKTGAMIAAVRQTSAYSLAMGGLGLAAKGATTAISGVAAMFGRLAAVLLAHPIMALAAVIFSVTASTRGFKAAIEDVTDAVKILGFMFLDVVGNIVDGVKWVWGVISDWFKNTIGGGGAVTTFLGSVFGKWFEGTRGGFVGLLQVIARVFDSVIKVAATTVMTLGKGFYNLGVYVQNIAADMGNALVGAMNWAARMITGIINSISGGINTVIRGINSISGSTISLVNDDRQAWQAGTFSKANTINNNWGNNMTAVGSLVDQYGFNALVDRGIKALDEHKAATDAASQAALDAVPNFDAAGGAIDKMGKDAKGAAKNVNQAKGEMSDAEKAAQALNNAFLKALQGLKREQALFGEDSRFATWVYDLNDEMHELYRLSGAAKNELISLATTLDVSEFNRQMFDANNELTHQVQLLEAQSDLEREILGIKNDALKLAAKYEVFNRDETRDIYEKIKEMISLNEQRAIEVELLRASVEINKELADATADLNKQIFLFGNDSPIAALNYDLEFTEKYAHASESAIREMHDALYELEALKAGKAFSDVLAGVEGVSDNPVGKIMQEYEDRLEAIRHYENTHTELLEESAEARLQVERLYNQARAIMYAESGEAIFGSISSMAKDALGEQSGIYRAMFAIEKGFAIARSVMAIQSALASATASLPFPANLPVIAQVASQGASIISNIKSVMPKGFKQGGYTGSIGANNIAGVVHGNEYVFDAQSTKAIGVENLERIRRGKNTGEVNITVNNHSSAKVETETDSQGNIIMTIRDEVKRSWSNLQNPNSHESKMLGRNVQAPRRR